MINEQDYYVSEELKVHHQANYPLESECDPHP